MRSRMESMAVLLLLLLVGVGLWKTHGDRRQAQRVVLREPTGVMGTSCQLIAVARDGDGKRAEESLDQVRNTLARIESRMSSWIDSSELSHLNTSRANQPVALSAETLFVLRRSRQAYDETGGIFDVTCRPLVQLWRNADRENQLPTREAIEQARAESGWSMIRLGEKRVTKTTDTARIDLGGIAKGYAIDCSIEVLQAAGMTGGLVDIGGDIRCFGHAPRKNGWKIQIQHPFGAGVFAEFQLAHGAVCTSGNYARPRIIQGRRYHHILDPRQGRPARIVAATVIGPTALEADVWATALNVLGAAGIDSLPTHLDALVIGGSAGNLQLAATAGFAARLPSRFRPQVEIHRLPPEGGVGQPRVKRFLRDWSAIDDPGDRAETFVACHLLKAVEGRNDMGPGEFQLGYLRDTNKREVDFVVIRRGRPWFLAEVKHSDDTISSALKHFQQQTEAPFAFQVVIEADYVDADCFASSRGWLVVPARTLLSQLL